MGDRGYGVLRIPAARDGPPALSVRPSAIGRSPGGVMSLVTVHLRWNDIGPEQYDRVVRAVSEAGRPPAGCLSTQLRRTGTALMATEVWDSEVAGNRMDHLVTTVRDAGVEQRPMTAM